MHYPRFMIHKAEKMNNSSLAAYSKSCRSPKISLHTYHFENETQFLSLRKS